MIRYRLAKNMLFYSLKDDNTYVVYEKFVRVLSLIETLLHYIQAYGRVILKWRLDIVGSQHMNRVYLTVDIILLECFETNRFHNGRRFFWLAG